MSGHGTLTFFLNRRLGGFIHPNIWRNEDRTKRLPRGFDYHSVVLIPLIFRLIKRQANNLNDARSRIIHEVAHGLFSSFLIVYKKIRIWEFQH